MLDVRRLRLLRELAARGTLTAVADALAYTPSAVSQQLAALERDAGVALLERVGRGVRLTDAGRRLVDHADAVIARLEAAEADLAAAAETGGRVQLAAFQTAVSGLVLPAMARLPAGVQVLLLEGDAEIVLPTLRLGDLDMVVAEEYEHAPRPRDPAFEREELCVDPMLVAVPARHPVATEPHVSLAALARETWATARDGTAFADMLVRTCRAQGGFEPRIGHRSNDLRVLHELVAQGHAVALVPGLGEPSGVEGVAVRPLERAIDRRIYTVVRHGTAARPALRAVRRALVAQAQRRGLRAPRGAGHPGGPHHHN
jgi:DNA-binding transcriptional LysR family regulator